MDFKEVGWKSVDWTNLSTDRDKWCVEDAIRNLRVPYNDGNFLSS
jgi:hypothetical protein